MKQGFTGQGCERAHAMATGLSYGRFAPVLSVRC
jgi:hypothetical protein